MNKTKLREYALYKGEKFISVGTSVELASLWGVSPKTIRFWSTPYYRRKFKDDKNRLICIKLEDDE